MLSKVTFVDRIIKEVEEVIVLLFTAFDYEYLLCMYREVIK